MSLSIHVYRTSVLLGGLLLLASGPGLAQSRVEAALQAANEQAANLRPAAADAAFRDLLDRNPDDPAVLTQYGVFKRLWGEYSEAIPMLERATELSEDQFTLYQLGLAYRFSRRYGAASSVFRRVIGLNPTNAGARQQLAFTELARGNRGQALRHLQVAERLFGDVPADWRLAQLASVYAQLGRQADAQRLFDALSRTANASHASLALGNVAVGDYEQALEHVQAAVDNPQAVPGALNTLSQLRANPFGDPALAGPVFQDALAGLGHP